MDEWEEIVFWSEVKSSVICYDNKTITDHSYV